MVGVTGMVLLTGIAAGYFAFDWAYDEAIEFQDSLLLQVGALAQKAPLPVGDTVLPGVDQDSQLHIEEWKNDAPSPGVFRSAGLSADAPDGLQTLSHAAAQWRVLILTRNDGSRIAIGQDSDYREEIARGSALRTVVPLGVLFPCLMVLVIAIIRTGFGPVARLAADLDAKQPDHLTKLPANGMPNELRPFIESINRLLDRIGALFEQQKRFIAHAAHELRTPITALSLQIENLDNVEASPDIRDRIKPLREGARRSARLLDQLLTLARFESGRETSGPATRLDFVAKDVLAEAMLCASRRQIDLGFERCDPVSVAADPTSLAIIVRNIVDNAIRHTPDNGRIDLRVGDDAEDALVEVCDSGPGITPADLPRIAEPFFRGSAPKGEGTGLGLSIVQRIIARLNGSLAIENISGPSVARGLRVTVRIPRTA